MLLPHRTAWTTQVEFQSVYSDLFESDGDAKRQQVGLSRIAVWQSRKQCPSAVETTANLLRLILLDTSSSSALRPSAHELRLSYSMAIIRFVNSLVDPLQTAYFARSISSLAAQLGLPLWFVELRHQATHEDLPGLPVLREGARQALDWLYVHYWQPTITNSSLASTSNASSTLPPLPLEPFISSLNSYKSLMKSLQKDASQAGKIKNELGRIYRELERWGIENGVSSPESVGKRTRKNLNPNGLAGLTAMRTRERAMETVAGLLVDELGWLVPLAKKKRPSTRSPSLPQPLIELYTPLLEFLDETLFAQTPTTNDEENASDDSDSFIDTLVSRIVDILCATNTSNDIPSEGGEKEDPTVHMTLQAWLLHLVPLPQQGESIEAETIETIEGILKTCLIAGTPSSITLVDALLARTAETLPQLSQKVEPLLRILRTNQQQASSSFTQGVKTPEEAERLIAEILERSSEIEKKLASISTESTANASNAALPPSAQNSATTSNGSWSLVSNFKPSPIGSLPLAGGGFEGLDLVR
ncbi:hypothetical protein JCM3765_001551 [Sporobolomyces pararoseus]